MYKCVKKLIVDMYDDDNEIREDEHMEVDEGSEWLIEECGYCENDIRLVNDDADWIEIDRRTFKEHFVEAISS